MNLDISRLLRPVVLFFVLVFLIGCLQQPGADVVQTGISPRVSPDIGGVTVPPNIAPLNFRINEKGEAFFVRVKNENGDELTAGAGSDATIRFGQKKWKAFLDGAVGTEIRYEVFARDENGRWEAFEPLKVTVAREPMDPYIAYRLLYPGYENWVDLSIRQRNIENFDESKIIENRMIDHSCVNCHNFRGNDPGHFMLHVRAGEAGGTYLVDDGEVTKTNLKTNEMFAGAVYPAYHPAKDFIAFSSNSVVQDFYAHNSKRVEVYDKRSSLVLYDIEKNEMMSCGNDSGLYMETFPSWSPDGNYLYYCRTAQVNDEFDLKDIRYDIYRKWFDSSKRKFGPAEPVFDASAKGKSASFPRISPDGRYMVFTLADYGTFPIWHDEADLYLVDLQTGEFSETALNSPKTESYHSWSSNGSWMVFSSRRMDGLTTRLYLSHFSNGKFGKPFLLPQKDPGFYDKMTKSYNVPEFVTGKVRIGSREIVRSAKAKAKAATWSK